jgi:hypothetical protein
MSPVSGETSRDADEFSLSLPVSPNPSLDPKAKMLFLQSFLRKGVSLGYVERNCNLKDLKDAQKAMGLMRGSGDDRK